MSNEIVWEEPPNPTRKSPGEYDDMLVVLEGHPNQWARLGTYESPKTAHVAAHRLRQRIERDGRTFEVIARQLKNGDELSGGLYARYLDG